MAKYILLVLLLFLVGVIGGLWSQAFLLPSLAANPAFKELQFVKDWNARTQVIAPVEQVFIRENTAIEKVVEEVADTVVAVQSVGAKQGSGLVYTSDGLIITLSSLIPAGFAVTIYPESGDSLPATVLKRDVVNNLVLLKIEHTDLQTAGFVGNGGVHLAEDLVLLAKTVKNGESTALVQTGIIKKATDISLATSIVEQANVNGAPLFDVEGKVVGLAEADYQGNIYAIPSSVLREFLGL